MELVLSVQFPLRYYESSTMLSFFLKNLGERLYEDEIRGLLEDGDEGDGTISYSKFFAMDDTH